MSKKPTIKLRPNVRPSVEPQPLLKSAPTLPLDKLADISNSDFYRPRKKQISIRLDADILAWFQGNFDKYQSAINRACRVYMNLNEQTEDA